jgi:hypothetical protein
MDIFSLKPESWTVLTFDFVSACLPVRHRNDGKRHAELWKTV